MLAIPCESFAVVDGRKVVEEEKDWVCSTVFGEDTVAADVIPDDEC